MIKMSIGEIGKTATRVAEKDRFHKSSRREERIMKKTAYSWKDDEDDSPKHYGDGKKLEIKGIRRSTRQALD